MTESHQAQEQPRPRRPVSVTDIGLVLVGILTLIIVCHLVQDVVEAGYVGSFTRFEATLFSPALIAFGVALWLRFRRHPEGSGPQFEPEFNRAHPQDRASARAGMLDFGLECFAVTALFWGMLALAEALGGTGFDIVDLLIFDHIVPPASGIAKVAGSIVVALTLFAIVWRRRKLRSMGKGRTP